MPDYLRRQQKLQNQANQAAAGGGFSGSGGPLLGPGSGSAGSAIAGGAGPGVNQQQLQNPAMAAAGGGFSGAAPSGLQTLLPSPTSPPPMAMAGGGGFSGPGPGGMALAGPQPGGVSGGMGTGLGQLVGNGMGGPGGTQQLGSAIGPGGNYWSNFRQAQPGQAAQIKQNWQQANPGGAFRDYKQQYNATNQAQGLNQNRASQGLAY